jgi:predicted transposase/invertase (TIGR01784 family)
MTIYYTDIFRIINYYRAKNNNFLDNHSLEGKQLIPRIREELPKVKQQQELLELIETILVYKLPQVSRKEIEAMFSLSDLKQTKLYQEALEEGELAAKLASIPRLLALGLKVEQIAQALELEIEQVRQATQRE